MLVSRELLLMELGLGATRSGMQSVRIPVEWSTGSFECRIHIRAKGAGGAPIGAGPVRLRVSEPVADYCRLDPSSVARPP